MAVVRRQTTKAKKAEQDSELARISAVVEQMKSEWLSQKQSLEQKIESLETELAQTNKLAQAGANRASEEGQPTSRRRMLKRLGAAAAGLAVVSVAAGVATPETAEAAPFSMLLNDGTVAGPDGVVNSVTGTSTINGPSSGGVSGMVLQVKNPFTSVVSPTVSNPNPNDAIVATSANGIGVVGTTTGGALNSGVQGIQGSGSTIQAAVAAQVAVGSKGAGVIGLSDSNNGVNGFSAANVGVLGFSSSNYGMVAQVGAGATQITGSAPLLIIPEPQTGGPSVGSHVKGELHVDSNAEMYICTVGGSPAALSQSEINRRFPHADAQDKARLAAGAGAQFAKFLTTVGATPGLTVYLPVPLRLVGNPNPDYSGAFPSITAGTSSYFPIAGFTVTNNNTGGPVTGSIPANASGVIGVISSVAAPANGYATVYPGNAGSAPEIASISYPPLTVAVVTGSAFSVKLGPIPVAAFGHPINTPGIAVFSQQTCRYAIDVVAYTT